MNRNTLIIFLIITVLEIAVSFAAPQLNDQSQVREATATAGPMGYQEWKKNQVFDARMNLDKFKSPQLSKIEKEGEVATNTGEGADPEKAKPSVEEKTGSRVQVPQENKEEATAKVTDAEKAEQLRQLEFNLEIAQGLTVHDYFALYLKNKSKQEMAQAIQKLSPGELSDLLMAYRKSLYGVPVPEKSTDTALKKSL